MFETIWEVLRPIIIAFLNGLIHDPATQATIILALGAILAVLKIPKFIADIIISLIKKLFESVKKTERKAEIKAMTSKEKLDFAIDELKNSNLTAGEKRILRAVGAKKLIENLALPELQSTFKKKPEAM